MQSAADQHYFYTVNVIKDRNIEQAVDKFLKSECESESVSPKAQKKAECSFIALVCPPKPGEGGLFTLTLLFVPPTGRFYEPFLQDLELIWRIDFVISIT